MENDLVTIRRYHFLGEAQVIRGLLESAGIPCFVANQVTASHSVFAGGLGGVRLQVRSRDVESAEELLQEELPQEVVEQDLAPGAFVPEAEATCPSCSLGVISVKGAGRECLNCGYRWME